MSENTFDYETNAEEVELTEYTSESDTDVAGDSSGPV